MLAGTFMDPIMGLDLHFEISPIGVPIMMPNVFLGILFDPRGLAMTVGIANVIGNLGALYSGGSPQLRGPVLINSLPAAATGYDGVALVRHIALPPGITWAPIPMVETMAPAKSATQSARPPVAPLPTNDALTIFGSKSVEFMGGNAMRSFPVFSCSQPIRLPTSFLMPMMKGLPVMVGGPMGVDWLQAIIRGGLGAYRMFRNYRSHHPRVPTNVDDAARGADDAAQADDAARAADDTDNARASTASSRADDVNPNSAQKVCGDPVVAFTGAVVVDRVDWSLPGPLPLVFSCSYSSKRSRRRGVLGHGWSHPLDQAIWCELGCVVYRMADGREIEFDTMEFDDEVLPVGQQMYLRREQLTLHRHREHEWSITTHDGTVHRFEVVPNDRVVGYARLQSIRTRQGHSIELQYNERADLAWVRDSAGRLVAFEHDAIGRLTRVALPDPERDGWLPHTRYEYNDAGDLIAVHDALGNATRYEYVNHLLVRKTDRAGLSFYYGYDSAASNARCIRTWGDGGIFDTTINFVAAKRTTLVRDSNDALQIITHDANGLVQTFDDADGGVWKLEYDASRKLTSETDPVGNTTKRVYDERGNCITVVLPDGAQKHAAYDAHNDRVEVRDPMGAVWRMEYSDRGELLQVRDPLGGKGKFRYANGLPVQVQPPGVSATVMERDAHGQITAVIEPTGARTEYTYDRRGRVVQIKNADGRVERFEFDALDRVVLQRHPDGTQSSVEYDGEGRVVRVEDRYGVREIKHDIANRRRRELHRDQSVTEVFYDSEFRAVEIRNQRNESTTLERDVCGRVIAETGYDGRTWRFKRDKAGHVVEVVRPGGARSRREYDRRGRMTAERFGDGTSLQYGYRADGAMTEARLGDAVTRWNLDALGRVEREWQNESWVQSRYDAAGRRVEMVTSEGSRAVFEHTAAGALQRLVMGAAHTPWEVNIERDRLQRETRRTMAGGVVATWARDAMGLPVQHNVMRGEQRLLSEQLEWKGHERITSRTRDGRKTTYQYDQRSRLMAAQGERAIEYCVKDSVGNVYRSADRSDRTYAKGSVLATLGPWEFAYDGEGRVIEKRRRVDGTRWRYQWNAVGLLQAVTKPDGERVEYSYDALGRRVEKRVGERSTRWSWDGDNIVCERGDDASAAVHWVWEPASFTPIAREQSGQKQSVVSDHLGVPIALCDERGQIVWRAEQGLDGRMREDVAQVPCPWRWPGQYEDADTGLFYNRFRQLDPESGTYLSSDPLGIAGNPTLYGYVENPLLGIDPLGLGSDQGHHTIPRQLMLEMKQRGMMSQAAYDVLFPVDVGPTHWRRGILPLPTNLHVQTHAHLSDFLNARYGLRLPAGYQHAPHWQSYLNALRSRGIMTQGQVLEDLRAYYREVLSDGVVPLTDEQLRLAREGFEHDAFVIQARGTCPP